MWFYIHLLKAHMKKILLALLLLASSNSYSMNGNELYELMISSDAYKNMQALRYVQGVGESIVFENWKSDTYTNLTKTICLPENYTNRQVYDIVMNKMKNTPQDRGAPAVALINVALLDAWPCK